MLGLDDLAERRRFLASAAQVQAVCGDIAGALQTADSIPDWKPGDGPAKDGRLDDDGVLKPITFALIASLQVEADDQAGADATFARAESLAEAVPTESERVVARVALVELLARSGRDDAARAAMDRALPDVLAQPEPRRSRLLCLLVEAMAEVDGVAEAAKVADAIRDEPGLEKAYAFRRLAVRSRNDGEGEAARALALRALPFAVPRPTDPQPRPGLKFALPVDLADYLDPEVLPDVLKIHRAMMMPLIRDLAGVAKPTAEDRAKADAWPLDQPGASAMRAYDRDGFEAAMAEIDAVASPTRRLHALRRMAQSLARVGR